VTLNLVMPAQRKAAAWVKVELDLAAKAAKAS